ncbi:MAG: PD-(D/E)XK nuclease family protein [Saccharospirillaceae bacterium]|nr:PD-(D/E)XK nuclease family protein [Pseudomonadales bacterium]NRB78703.1 PD-(D/E)XK nuclease family protein [Saccharospirillaceae bacterium]
MSKKQPINFVLMPDNISSAQFKDLLAQDRFSHVKVGDFSALINTISEYYLLPTIESMQIIDEYSTSIRDASLSLNETFWSKSIKVDETGVLAQLEQTLDHIYNSLALDTKLSTQLIKSDIHQATRITEYFTDTCLLAKKMGHLRPAIQEISRHFLDIADQPSTVHINLIIPEQLELNIWQCEVVNVLLSKNINNTQYQAIHKMLHATYNIESKNTDLQGYSKKLFNNNGQESTQFNKLNILSCRDPLEESEILVNRIQQSINEGNKPQDMVVVLPNNSIYQQLLPNLFKKSGIQVSNLSNTQEYQEWHIQLVKDLVSLHASKINRDDHIKPLQVASILINPLMPWSLKFAQYLLEKFEYYGNFDFVSDSIKHTELLTLLIESSEDLIIWLKKVVTHLLFPKITGAYNEQSINECLLHVERLLDSNSDLTRSESYIAVAKQLQPQRFNINKSDNDWLINSVLIANEKDLLLHPVQHLFIIGFNDTNYEPKLNINSVFKNSDWHSIEQLTGLNVFQSIQEDTTFEHHFKRYFQIASNNIEISLSELDFDGSKLQPSQTIIDLALVSQSKSNIDIFNLINNIKNQPDFPFLKFNKHIKKTPEVSNNKTIHDLNLNTDLINLHKDKDNNQKPESPSSLDKMMISPLAWLLDKQGLRSKAWDIQDFSVTLMGTIAHKVFELHFKSDNNVSLSNYDELFDKAILAEAPFINIPKWRMERKQLKEETRISLTVFSDFCKNHDWENYMQEGRLTGELFNLPVKGFVDAVFKKDNDLLIVDYKKSASKKFVSRLNSGFELQTMIYRKLIINTQPNAKTVRSGYFTLNDKTLVLDKETECSIRELQQVQINNNTDEQSMEAETLIKLRIEQLKKGVIELNGDDHKAIWDKRGINTEYSISSNTLVSNFLKSSVSKEKAS